MKVLALTSGDRSLASSFYRVYQYVDFLAAEGIHLEAMEWTAFRHWQDLPKYDCVLLQKKLISGSKFRRLRRGARKLVFDVDDAIWFPQGKPHSFLTQWRIAIRLRRIAAHANLCLAANQVLASHLNGLTPTEVTVLPMSLPAKEWQFGTKVGEPGGRIGWAGAPGNLPYLENLELALSKTLAKFPDWRFTVYSGRRPNFRHLPFEHIRFAPGTEKEAIRTFDIGLLPLPDTPFAAGKSPIKALQYFASEVATIASPIGATREIVRDGETGFWAQSGEQWIDALSRLISDQKLRAGIASRGRSFFEEVHSAEVVGARLAEILRNLTMRV